jgi:hypothetical protein
MQSASVVAKKNKEASEALSDVSRLLSRLAKSRKAPSKLDDIINLTREVARLGRALNGSDYTDGADDGYGDKEHYAKISVPSKVRNVVR